MRLKNKKHKHFSRTDNKKYQEQNHKKEKTNNNNNYCHHHYFYRIRVHYTVLTQHTTPQTTPTKRSCSSRGDLIEQQYLCCSRHPTACQKTKQTTPEHKHTLLKPSNQQAERPQKVLVPLIPKPHTTRKSMRVILVLPEKPLLPIQQNTAHTNSNKKLATTRC